VANVIGKFGKGSFFCQVSGKRAREKGKSAKWEVKSTRAKEKVK